jgi:Uma2 family endonuclease
MPVSPSLLTAEEFAAIPDDEYRYELVAGRIVRMSPPGCRHGALATRIAALLNHHVVSNGLGVVLTPSGFKLASHPDTVREPDVAFVRRERTPPGGIPESFWPGPPDLAVEIVSPGDRRADVLRKVDEYLMHGAAVVWVVETRQQSVTVYRRLSPPVRHGVDDALDAADILPGFTCEVGEIFRDG